MRFLWRYFFPFLAWWPEVNRRSLRGDSIAALTGAVACIPQGVAFATIAGMPPQYGLYAAMVPAIVASLFGSSRLMISGPATPASIVLFSTLGAMALPETAEYVQLAITLAFMVGVVQLLLGLAGLGNLVNFISHSVVVGFSAGAGLLIVASQLHNFLGLEIERGLQFHEILIESVTRFTEADAFSVTIGVITIAAGLISRKYLPQVPFMVGALVVGTVLGAAFNFIIYAGFAGIGHSGVETFHAVPATLPPLSHPDLRFETIKELAPAAVTVALFTLAQAVSISRSLAARSGDQVSGNQEFVGQGLSNIAGSFFSSYVSTGSLNRSAVNAQSGARTPVAGILTGLVVMGAVVVIAPLLEFLPTASMAGLLFIVAWGLIDFKQIRKISRTSATDTAALWATFGAALIFSLDFAILLGVLLSLLVYLKKAAQPEVDTRVPDPRSPLRRFTADESFPQCPQLAIVRIDGPLFFGSTSYVTERLDRIKYLHPGQKHLLILARSVTHLDYSGAELLAEEQQIRASVGGQLYLHQLKDEPRALLRDSGYLDAIGEENLFEAKGEAIGAIFEKLNREICMRCEARIFNECRTVPKAPP